MKTTVLRSISFFILFIALCTPLSTFAASVQIDVGDYDGFWRINNEVAQTDGSATVDLSAGQYNLVVGNIGNVNFEVDAAGIVTSNNLGAATGGSNILSLNTTDIHIDPGNFLVQNYGTTNVQWSIGRVTSWMTSAADVTLVKGVSYVVRAGTFGNFTIALDENGAVTVNNGVSASVSGNSLTFNTIEISVDPGDFLNQPHPAPFPRWGLSRVIQFASTAATINVVPGVRYAVNVGTYGQFFINVDTSGNISVENGYSAIGGYRNLEFNTVTLNVDPGDFADQADGGVSQNWSISRVVTWDGAASDVRVVPGVKYGVFAGAYGVFYIDVGEFGDITVQNGISATVNGSDMVFNTESVLVDPGSFSGDWTITYALHEANGANFVNLVPGARYRLAADASIDFFNVYSPCAVDTPTISFPNSTFSLSCGLPDLDDDGIPDVSDNCPSVDNADQLDQDTDGAGDACDSDIDGDGVANTSDNCPDFANSSQSDLDGDGLGDDCDGDTDGDSVADNADNCQLTPNPGQGDSDGDGAGDECDVDDDNDGFADEADNCPLTWNPQQSDFDGNGQGDACDGDIDGDWVSNPEDDCAATPMDQPITDNGCSGSQFVALQCPTESFNQHGQYVSCVAHTAKDLADDGVIGKKEKSVLVKEAAKKK